LEILKVKSNPQNSLYTSLGVITKGTILEVNISELEINNNGKFIWGNSVWMMSWSSWWKRKKNLFRERCGIATE
jgi:ribosomal protein S8E